MEQRLREVMASAKVPTNRDLVYKDECMFSFDTPESPGGLFTSLTTWQSFGADFVDLDFRRNNNPLYLKQVWKRVILCKTGNDASVAEKVPSKIAIGVEGGFDVDKKPYDTHVTNYLVVLPEQVEVMLPSDLVPMAIVQAVDAVLKHDGVAKTTQLAAAWEEEDRKESKYAKDLIQLDTRKKISPDPRKWKCEESGMTENLWLNLSTGFIGSGRRNWDGSGGTGAALTHYENTGCKYPLAVKLGTITAQGADVYSYAPDEDDMVTDPYLAQHLAHWGINMMQQEKTEKTMTELQLDLNQSYQFDRITESSSELVPLHGPGYIGLENMGNSCYMASVMQILLSIPEIEARYGKDTNDVFFSAPKDPADDILTMMSKLAVGLSSDRYAKPLPLYEKDPAGTGELRLTSAKLSEDYGSVSPFMFKRIIGKGHPEFSSGRQQDASEFFQYFLEIIANAEQMGHNRFSSDREAGSKPVSTQALFGFMLEERIEDCQSKKFKYMSRAENTLSLTIDTDAATNKAQYYEFREQRKKKLRNEEEGKDETDFVQLQVPLSACLQKFCEAELIEDFLSPETGTKGSALKRTRFQTFPQYLVVHLKRYYITEDWTPKKLDAAVLMPQELDLNELKASGPLPGEEMLSDEIPMSYTAVESSPSIVPNPEIVSQLMAMGFSENGSKRAALATMNAGTEASMEWVFAHMEDPDFNDPPPPAGVIAQDNPLVDVSQDSDAIAQLTAMGFTERQAKAALMTSDGSLERAADWLFSQPSGADLDAAIASIEAEADGAECREEGEAKTMEQTDFVDGEPRYELLGFASHLGSNTSCGHYVAHIKKDGRFVLYNDAKVALSQNPPIDLGFLYVYRRK